MFMKEQFLSSLARNCGRLDARMSTSARDASASVSVGGAASASSPAFVTRLRVLPGFPDGFRGNASMNRVASTSSVSTLWSSAACAPLAAAASHVWLPASPSSFPALRGVSCPYPVPLAQYSFRLSALASDDDLSLILPVDPGPGPAPLPSRLPGVPPPSFPPFPSFPPTPPAAPPAPSSRTLAMSTMSASSRPNSSS